MDNGTGPSSPGNPILPTWGTGEIYGLLEEACTRLRVTHSLSTCVLTWGTFFPVILHVVQGLTGLGASDYSLCLGPRVISCPEMPD